MRPYLILLFFSPVVAFSVHFILAWTVRLAGLKINPLLVGALGVLGGLIVTGILISRIYFISFETGLYAFLVYGGLSFAYFQFFAMTETARRIHILKKLYASGPISLSDLQADYGGSKMLTVRLERMVTLNQLIIKGDRYFIGKRLILFVGRVMDGWAGILGFKRG